MLKLYLGLSLHSFISLCSFSIRIYRLSMLPSLLDPPRYLGPRPNGLILAPVSKRLRSDRAERGFSSRSSCLVGCPRHRRPAEGSPTKPCRRT